MESIIIPMRVFSNCTIIESNVFTCNSFVIVPDGIFDNISYCIK